MADDRDTIVISRFAGNSDVDHWISIVEAAAKTKEWDNATLLSQAVLRLSGNALLWAQNSGAIDATSWASFKEQLTLRYREQLNDAAIRAELAKVRRNRGESILAFSDRIQAIFKKARSPLSESTKVEYLVRGMPAELQFSLFLYAREHPDAKFIEMVRMVNDFEALNVSADVGPLKPAAGGPTEVIKCGYCHKIGHTTEACRRKLREEAAKQEAQAQVIQAKLRSEAKVVPPAASPSGAAATFCKYCKATDHDISQCAKLREKEKRKAVNAVAAADPDATA